MMPMPDSTPPESARCSSPWTRARRCPTCASASARAGTRPMATALQPSPIRVRFRFSRSPSRVVQVQKRGSASVVVCC
eukprot:CAMPEP_0174863150 /NCGR_PEP_ID=MMETSP1114-20130205/55614_1 /TAXON_ID=312471 /ORGANISM="Neobodo designis, Strain CCAP 1951/1" /LENGTH=77 /DNA_ID=CAMNT_0016098211 /DNA_START=269 /DNA_END=499 /DNA_ORIENTATION=-